MSKRFEHSSELREFKSELNVSLINVFLILNQTIFSSETSVFAQALPLPEKIALIFVLLV